jgi:hypothetical protein
MGVSLTRALKERIDQQIKEIKCPLNNNAAISGGHG